LKLARTKEWRESHGLTQRELAAAAGVGEVTVARVETWASVSPPTARKLAEVLDVSVADLLERPPVPLAEASQETGHTEAEVEEEQRPDDEVTRRRIYSGLAEARALLLESTAELWDRLLDRGEDNVDTLRLIEHVTTKEIINHAIDEEEIKERCAPEQRDQLERAEQRLLEADRRVSQAIEAKLPSREIDKRRAARAEHQAKFQHLGIAKLA
jgi:transcriptional regulator with XRE-family HTH domain